MNRELRDYVYEVEILECSYKEYVKKTIDVERFRMNKMFDRSERVCVKSG